MQKIKEQKELFKHLISLCHYSDFDGNHLDFLKEHIEHYDILFYEYSTYEQIKELHLWILVSDDNQHNYFLACSKEHGEYFNSFISHFKTDLSYFKSFDQKYKESTNSQYLFLNAEASIKYWQMDRQLLSKTNQTTLRKI